MIVFIDSGLQGKKGIKQAFSNAIPYDAYNEPKIKLNNLVKNDLDIRIGEFVYVHRCPDAKKPLHILSTDDDNLKCEYTLLRPGNKHIFIYYSCD